MGHCSSCGVFHGGQSNCFCSMMFSTAPNQKECDEEMDYMYSFASNSSSVDCTLSLGTPSTRLSSNEDDVEKRSRVSNFSWNLFQTKHSASSAPKTHKSDRAGGNVNSSGNDSLLARRCANCDTTSTPLWRNGPRGPKSLCNACGIRFKKEERRAAAATNTNDATTAAMIDSHSHNIFSHHNNNPWLHQSHSTHKSPPFYSPAIGNEFRFINDGDQDSDSGGNIPYLSWRLNVTDRPNLVHDFTR